MTDEVSRRGFLRRCLTAIVAAPALPAIVEAAIGMPPRDLLPHLPSDELIDWMASEALRNSIGGEYANEHWNRGFSTRYVEAFYKSATHDYHFSGWIFSDVRPAPRPEAPGLEWLVTEDAGPAILPVSICGRPP